MSYFSKRLPDKNFTNANSGKHHLLLSFKTSSSNCVYWWNKLPSWIAETLLDIIIDLEVNFETQRSG